MEAHESMEVKDQPGVLAQVTDETLDILRAPSLRRHFLVLAQGLTEESSKTGISPGQLFIKDQDPEKSVPVGRFEKYNGKLQCRLECVYGHWRPKAVLLVDNQPVLESFQPGTPNFKRILDTPEVKPGAGPKTVTPLFGIETLFYIPPHMFDFEAIRTDRKRGLEESDIAALMAKYKNGCVSTFFWCKTNREFTCGGPPSRGSADPGTPFILRTEEKETKKFSWWQMPSRTVIAITDENKEWIEYGRRQFTAELLAGFHNPPSSSGEAIETDGKDDDR